MTIKDLEDHDLIIFKAIVGSQSHGTATENSDIDYRGVFMLPLEDVLNYNYVPQVSDEMNNETYYELRRFLELVEVNNPNIIEILATPEDCIVYKDPIFDLVLQNKDKILSKLIEETFGGYAATQIKKARGLNKKIFKPVDERRKTVLEFCYVPYNQGSISIEDYCRIYNIDHTKCGLVAINHMRYTYNVFIPDYGKFYRGVVKDPLISNDVHVSSIPKGVKPDFIMQFNMDGYKSHCKDHREYWDWVEKRNQSRFSDNMLHDGGYDGKNLATCHRLLDMAIEIGEGRGINVRRPNRQELLDIRKGVYDYNDLLTEVDKKLEKIKTAFSNSNLPDSVDHEFINDLLLEMRMKRYFIEDDRCNFIINC